MVETRPLGCGWRLFFVVGLSCGAAKPWKSSGMENFCRVRAETIETLAIFRPLTKILPTKRPPFWGPETGPKMEATHSVSI